MSKQYLIADIGATNARFALLDDLQSGVLQKQRTLPAKDHADMTEAVQAYLAMVGKPSISAACLAIAGPVHEAEFNLANNHWLVNKRAVEAVLGCEALWLNDFAVQAWGVTQLDPKQQKIIKSGTVKLGGNRLVIGPGSGLGVAGLVVADGRWVVVTGEGGHASFAPSNAQEIAVLSHLLKQYEHVSVERVASGSGIPVLYQALAELAGAEVRYHQADKIAEAAEQGGALAQQAMTMFFAILGQAVASAALVMGATSGVYLVGGILPKLQEQLDKSDFVARFARRERFRSYLEDVPVILSLDPDLGLKGAAIALAAQQQ